MGDGLRGDLSRITGRRKNMISKVAADHPKSWSQYLGHVLWALRELS